MTIELRSLQRTELGALAKIHAVCFPTDGWTVRDFMELLAIRGATGHVAVGENDAIAGFILDIVGIDDAEILTLGTVPEARRRGIGRLLIDNLARRAKQKSVSRVLLEVASDNFAAIALYESYGFKLLGERPGYYRRPGGKIDAYIFALSLARTLDGA